MKNVLRKKGDIATPKEHPQLKGKITRVSKFIDQTVYQIRGGLYTEEDLEPVENKKEVKKNNEYTK